MFKGAQVANNGSGSASLDLPVPPASDGELLLMHGSIRGAVAVTTPTGWTPLQNVPNGTAVRLATYWRIASSEPASYTLALGASQQAIGAISVYDAVNQAAPIDANGYSSALASANPTAQSVTTLHNDEIIVVFASHAAGATFTAQAGMTKRYDGRSGTISLAAADELRPSAGLTGSRRVTASVSAPWVAHMIALRSA